MLEEDTTLEVVEATIIEEVTVVVVICHTQLEAEVFNSNSQEVPVQTPLQNLLVKSVGDMATLLLAATTDLIRIFKHQTTFTQLLLQ